jgi:hypothetical protein
MYWVDLTTCPHAATLTQAVRHGMPHAVTVTATGLEGPLFHPEPCGPDATAWSTNKDTRFH